jgi:hypothetical protein
VWAQLQASAARPTAFSHQLVPDLGTLWAETEVSAPVAWYSKATSRRPHRQRFVDRSPQAASGRIGLGATGRTGGLGWLVGSAANRSGVSERRLSCDWGGFGGDAANAGGDAEGEGGGDEGGEYGPPPGVCEAMAVLAVVVEGPSTMTRAATPMVDPIQRLICRMALPVEVGGEPGRWCRRR